ncbi:CBO0543 family protein [Radiobacillus sp. PE A8.2]|uniref:CBO0543 family protein n=1 Tax=Radiobacillus sp. PE A8.2 TaxID=3380349 RepID=UPI00388E1FAD
MHVAIALFVIFAVWRWGDWKNWEKYHAVMLYFAIGNLTYNFLTASYFLWRLDADLISNHTLTEMLYTFIIFPGSAMLFIYHYPKSRWKIIRHYAYWIFIYAGIELIMVFTGHIEYQYGWNWYWSAGFDVFMFPMLQLFYKRPLIAYVISVPIAIFFIWYFNVPVHLPVEER